MLHPDGRVMNKSPTCRCCWCPHSARTTPIIAVISCGWKVVSNDKRWLIMMFTVTVIKELSGVVLMVLHHV